MHHRNLGTTLAIGAFTTQHSGFHNTLRPQDVHYAIAVCDTIGYRSQRVNHTL